MPGSRRGHVPAALWTGRPGIGPSLPGGREALSEISVLCVNLARSRDCCPIGDFKPQNASSGEDVRLRAQLASSFRARLQFAIFLTRKLILGSLVSGECDEFLKMGLQASRGRPFPGPKGLVPATSSEALGSALGFVLTWLALQALI